MQTTNKNTITITLTVHEAEWLRNALSIAASACAEPAPVMAKWTHAFALGLEAKIQTLTSEVR